MNQYETLSEALSDLQERGYDHDFNRNILQDDSHNIPLSSANFRIKEVHRFEGMTNPDDSAVLYAIESSAGVKGVLVNAYGMYTNSSSDRFINNLAIPAPVNYIQPA